MRTEMLLKALFVSTLLISSFAFAKTITITCPLADQVQIVSGRATGNATITDFQRLIQMGGDTKSIVAFNYSGSEFYDGMLACAYQGNRGSFGIMNYDINGNLTNCHFNNGKALCKSSDIHACALMCDGSGLAN